MQFALNRPALQTAGQILLQQCHAAAATGNAQAPSTDDLVLLAITELTRAAAGARTGQLDHTAQPLRPQLEVSLARTMSHISHLAALQGIDLGSAIANYLAPLEVA